MPTEEADFFLESYNFALPEAQIAQFPPEERWELASAGHAAPGRA